VVMCAGFAIWSCLEVFWMEGQFKVQAVLPLRGLLMSKARLLLADDNPAILEKAGCNVGIRVRRCGSRTQRPGGIGCCRPARS
jgi:hypothetical protein